VTPEQLRDMMTALVREQDEMRAALEALPEPEASDGPEVVSAGIRDVVERIRRMMRQSGHLIEGIDEVLQLYPANVAPELDAQRDRVLADRRAVLKIWSDLAGQAETLNESLMALARQGDEA